MFTGAKIQRIVKNSGMVLEILRMTQYGNHNVALLKRLTDGMLITVRDLTFYRDLECDWYWGHYFSKENEYGAYQDFIIREKEMTSYEEE